MRTQRDISLDNMQEILLNLSQEFEATFHVLSFLLKKAIVIDFIMENNQLFRQYIWIHKDRKTSGWLCRMDHRHPQNVDHIPEHLLLSKQIGGILHY